MLQQICLGILTLTAVYFACINVTYGALMFLSWMKVRRFRRENKTVPAHELPAVSFIVPAFNEESLIVETIQTYLSLPHQKKEIIVINDGSNDQTFRLLQNMFMLKRQDEKSSAFRSILFPELIVLEAPHMGKAQALNFGIAHAQNELVCTMDADTIPTARGVEGCLRAFAQDPKLISAGGVIQVLNSHVLKHNSPVEVQTRGWLTSFQGLEYLRTFLCERLGWSLTGSTILISGAFCMLRKEAIRKVGGFRKDSITEDLDLIIRLRKAYRGQEANFRTLPLTTCYTQVPGDRKHLMVQRMRWQMGLVETLRLNADMIFNPSYGFMGLITLPYALLVEVFSPVLAFLAFIAVPLSLIMDWISLEGVLFYLGAGLLFNVAITMFGIFLDNRYVTRNRRWPLLKSAWHTLLLHFGYKQMTSLWRLTSLLRSFRKRSDWGDKPRKEIIHQSL